MIIDYDMIRLALMRFITNVKYFSTIFEKMWSCHWVTLFSTVRTIFYEWLNKSVE